MPLGRFSPATDGPGPVLLGVQRVVVPGRSLLGVAPYRSPRTRVSARVPHRLGLAALVPLGVRASSGGDGVDQLPIGEGVPGPVEVGLKVAWGADLSRR